MARKKGVFDSHNIPYEKIGDEVVPLDVPFVIPDSWEWVRGSSLGEIVRGSGIKRTETVETGLPCVRYGELYTTYNISFTEAVSFIPEDIDSKCRHFSCGDVLMTLTGENKPDIAKAVAYLGETPIAAGGDLAYWTHHGLNPLYLVYALNSPYAINRKVDLATGDIIVHISGDKIGSILIPIPPLAEQDRIVCKIQELEVLTAEYGTKENSLSQLQNHFPEQLKKSILQWAVQGKLVPQDENDEPAEVLLERIRAEKEALIKAGKIKRDKHESVIFRRDNSHYEKLDGIERCIDDEIPFEIPDTWMWVRLGFISTYAHSKQKINAQMADPNTWGLDLEDIEKGGRLLTKKTVGDRKAVGDKTIFHRGDVLYSKLRPYLLKILVASNDGICTPEIVPFTMYGNIIAQYIVWYLSSPYVDNLINAITYGVKMPRVGTDTMTQLLVPIPPLAEQQRIVDKIEELLPTLKAL